jgi:hypothetical protein
MDGADEVGLPGDPEFPAAFASSVEWGTRLAVTNSQPDAEPPLEAPVPRWAGASRRRTTADVRARLRYETRPSADRIAGAS